MNALLLNEHSCLALIHMNMTYLVSEGPTKSILLATTMVAGYSKVLQHIHCLWQAQVQQAMFPVAQHFHLQEG